MLLAAAVFWIPLSDHYHRYRLRSSDETVRLDAIARLVQSGSSRSVPALVETFRSDSSARVRLAALRALEVLPLGGHRASVFDAVQKTILEEALSAGSVAEDPEFRVRVARKDRFHVEVSFGVDSKWHIVVGAIDSSRELGIESVTLTTEESRSTP